MDSCYEMLLKRRTIRSFKPDAVPQEILNKILCAAQYAPSAKGLQGRHFTVVQDQNLLKDIVSATLRCGGRFSPTHMPFYGAPDVIVLSAPENFQYNREDAACAAMNLMLAAYALGLGTCYICSVLPGLRDESITKRLSLPQGYVPFGCVSLGYPAQNALDPKPRRTDDVTYLR